MECSEKPVFYNYTGQELAQIRIMPPDEAVRKLVKSIGTLWQSHWMAWAVLKASRHRSEPS